jgi:hypothetical protein
VTMREIVAPSIAAKVNKWINDSIQAWLAKYIFLATVVAVNGTTIQLKQLGQSTADAVFYTSLTIGAAGVAANDQVVVLRVGANYVVLGRTTAIPGGVVAGTVALPAHVAGSGWDVIVTNPAVRAGSTIVVGTRNNNGDTTAGRLVSAYVTTVADGVFHLEYSNFQSMAHDWQAVYWIVG